MTDEVGKSVAPVGDGDVGAAREDVPRGALLQSPAIW